MKRVRRKWGYYRTLFWTPFFAVKLLVFKEKGRLSLQTHKYRNEFWLILSGYGYALYNRCHCDTKKTRYSTYWIPKGKQHKFKTADKECRILELQFGSKVSEKDIERFDND